MGDLEMIDQLTDDVSRFSRQYEQEIWDEVRNNPVYSKGAHVHVYMPDQQTYIGTGIICEVGWSNRLLCHLYEVWLDKLCRWECGVNIYCLSRLKRTNHLEVVK